MNFLKSKHLYFSFVVFSLLPLTNVFASNVTYFKPTKHDGMVEVDLDKINITKFYREFDVYTRCYRPKAQTGYIELTCERPYKDKLRHGNDTVAVFRNVILNKNGTISRDETTNVTYNHSPWSNRNQNVIDHNPKGVIESGPVTATYFNADSCKPIENKLGGNSFNLECSKYNPQKKKTEYFYVYNVSYNDKSKSTFNLSIDTYKSKYSDSKSTLQTEYNPKLNTFTAESIGAENCEPELRSVNSVKIIDLLCNTRRDKINTVYFKVYNIKYFKRSQGIFINTPETKVGPDFKPGEYHNDSEELTDQTQ